MFFWSPWVSQYKASHYEKCDKKSQNITHIAESDDYLSKLHTIQVSNPLSRSNQYVTLETSVSVEVSATVDADAALVLVVHIAHMSH